jgi:pilus assembly protein Flp/PilA
MVSSFAKQVVRFLHDDRGPTAVEYAVMLALIIVVCISAVAIVGANASNTFNFVGTRIQGDVGS